jgi:hypothetical protein
MTTKTINEQIAARQAEFCQLAKSTQSSLRRKAKELIDSRPHMANASTFWRGLSAIQVLAAK